MYTANEYTLVCSAQHIECCSLASMVVVVSSSMWTFGLAAGRSSSITTLVSNLSSSRRRCLFSSSFTSKLAQHTHTSTTSCRSFVLIEKTTFSTRWPPAELGNEKIFRLLLASRYRIVINEYCALSCISNCSVFERWRMCVCDNDGWHIGRSSVRVFVA